MPASPTSSPAKAVLRLDGDWTEILISGEWRMTQPRPSWADMVRSPTGMERPTRVRPRAEGLASWDSSLLLFLDEVRADAAARGGSCDLSALPDQVAQLLKEMDLAVTAPPAQGSHPRPESFQTMVGGATLAAWENMKSLVRFLGECVIGLGRVVKRPAKFRWHDLLEQMQQCGAMALPIASLIAFLIGLTFAYQSANTLRLFGADIWVADLVGILMVREMGPIMVAVILAGRTGAAFAATLGNMKTNEEIDALEVLGIPAVDFLVLPRLIALAVMMPLLVLYADMVGILGGMMVARGLLQIPATAYWIETRSIVGMTDVNSGLIKATAFGILIGLSGCLRGLQAERSAAGVGQAATSAVVTAIVLMIAADSIFAVVYQIFGI